MAIGNDTDLVLAVDRGSRTSGVPVTPEGAADALFDDPKSPVPFVAADEAQARRAVERFAWRFANAPGIFREVLDGARAGAEALSVDRFQGLAEIIQNADDAGGSRVTLRVTDGRLVAVHDGAPVTLSDVLAMATPWLSNKRDNSVATGRFGIGLMTLRALSDIIDVHSRVYHLRLGDPTLSPIESDVSQVDSTDGSTTSLCLPLRDEAIDTDALVAWLDRWDTSALLFLRNVRSISVLDSDGHALRDLNLEWSESTTSSLTIDGQLLDIRQSQARAADGRAWLVHTVEAPTPSNVRRLNKAAGSSVPLGVALPLQPEPHGAIYAGLPVQFTRAPIRVNAQFDPVTNRARLASTAWNRALLPLIGDLWAGAVAELYLRHAAAAWAAIPLPDATQDDATDTPVRELEQLLLDRARTRLATTAAIHVGGNVVLLTDLAVEDQELDGVLDPAEVAALAGLTDALPREARDAASRWRSILDDWRGAGAPLPRTVTVSDAVPLLAQVDRTTHRTIRLAAACLDAALGNRLTGLPCIVIETGEHVVPPAVGALHALVTARSSLVEELGLGMTLAVEHFEDAAPARTVLAWLHEIGAVIDDPDDEQVVRRLAKAGLAGNCLKVMLTDDQLRMLRDAFEQLPPSERSVLGPAVGRAIRIAAHTYDLRGRQISVSARPAEVYLSRAIDRESTSFAVAAGQTPGLLWADGRYADRLRSSLGRGAGLGAQKFLGLLGAERAPRLMPHSALHQRYSAGSRLGLAADATGSPPQRAAGLRDLGATHTLDDLDSPDLRAVALGISRERKASRRRLRATALLAVLARSWDRLRDQADVDAASAYYAWQIKGSTRAFWLWSVGAIAWLDDVGGVARTPMELRLRTAGTVAVHGLAAPGYVRPEFDAAQRPEVLTALGVAGEPSTGDLVSRLGQLRDSNPVTDQMATEVAIVYQGLAERLAGHDHIPGDLTERQLRDAFAKNAGLIYANLGWCTPSDVLAGPPVFGRRRAFVPQVPRTWPLWDALRVKNPSLDDCLQIIGELARTRRAPRDEDVPIGLETLRLLRDRLNAIPAPSSKTRRRLATLSLFTSQGWMTKRPVYSVHNPALVEGLGAELPIWEPGGEVAQFESLIGPLRVVRIGPDALKVIEPEKAHRDDDATELFATAISLLQDDLARNDPTIVGALTIGWDQLRSFEVRVTAELRVRIEGLIGRGALEVEVMSHLDVGREVLFLRDRRLVRQVGGAGRAVADLFADADHRQLAQAWLAACFAADEGRTAQRIQLAAQEAAEAQVGVEQQIVARTSALAEHIAKRQNDRAHRQSNKPTNCPPNNGTPSTASPPSPSEPAPAARTLVDPTTLEVVDFNGHPVTGPASPKPASRAAPRTSSPLPLPVPNRNAGPPRSHTAAAAFTPLDKESVGLEIARLVLASNSAELVDLRAQRGVGADAIDNLDRFFELKVHLGDEPDTIRLEQSQIERALSTPDFFVIIVSNIEGSNARPKTRIIADPLHQLDVTESSSVGFAGVHSAKHSLVYHLAPWG